MAVSLMLFGLPAEEYAPLTVRAEALGFEVVWLPDHLVTPLSFAKVYPYTSSGDPGYRPDTPLADVWVTIGYLAAVTSRIRLGSGVFILPLRNPFVTAKAVSMAQALSGGRVLFGVGTGWQREEYEAVGERFDGRGARTDEILAILAKLWSGQPVSHDGPAYHFPPVQLAPAPQAPPIVVGGSNEVALRRAGRLGQGWYGPNEPLEAMLAARERLNRYRSYAGRADEPFDYYVRLVGGLEAENQRRYADAGFEHLVVGLGEVPGYHAGLPLERKLELLAELGERVVDACAQT